MISVLERLMPVLMVEDYMKVGVLEWLDRFVHVSKDPDYKIFLDKH
jgi:hypothetical protein